MLAGWDRQLQGNFKARNDRMSKLAKAAVSQDESLCTYLRDESPSTSFDTNPSRCAPDWSRTSTTPVTLIKGENKELSISCKRIGCRGWEGGE